MNILTSKVDLLYNSVEMKSRSILLMILLAIASAVFYPVGAHYEVFLYAAAAASTALYEAGIRKIIFSSVNALFNGSISALPKTRKWEMRFYRLIKLHSLKNLLPPYDENILALQNGVENAIKGTIVTEIANATIIILGYLPLVFALILKSDLTFVIPLAAIGVVAGAYDLIMLFAQRYNRFRLTSISESRNGATNRS